MRVYLDTCCLNRLFDPALEARVVSEAEAVSSVLAHVYNGAWAWIGSDVLDAELNANPNRQVRAALRAQLRWVTASMPLTDNEIHRAEMLAPYGIKTVDGQHLACAEAGDVDLFLTTDDKLVKAARRAGDILRLSVFNPREWMEESAE
jgi:predicted nucleic acid-binding protein